MNELLVKCPGCDGTGEVHSHNSRCWDCNGSGKVSAAEAAVIKEAYRRMDKICPPRTGDYQ